MDNNNYIFDKKLLEKMKVEKPIYSIGVSTYDKNLSCYCLGRECNGKHEIILLKTIKDEIEFKQEVENISKYFNANIYSNK
jgi:hypothetical protein